MAEEKQGTKKSTARRDRVEKVTKKYSGLPAGEHAGVGGNHGTLKVPESGSYETSDPAEQAFIESVLGGVGK